MSEYNTYETGSEKGKYIDDVDQRAPFAFEGGAECYSDQQRRIGESDSEDRPVGVTTPSIEKELRGWNKPIGRSAEEETDAQAVEPPHNQDLGKRGEDAAARYLERRGYDILARNWTCKHGEADIIAKDENALVFIEVKTRSNCDYGMPEEAVTPAKRNKYERIAAAFLKEYPCSEIPVRFDVVGLLVISENRAMVKHHINAFGQG